MKHYVTISTNIKYNLPLFANMGRGALRKQGSENGLPLWRFRGKGPRPRLLVAIAAVAVLILSANTVSSAAAASRPSESAILIAALPKYNCPAGTVKLTPSSARRTAHGADVYHYTMKSGPGFDSYVPPAGFNPLAASNAVLAEMNMPTRPARGAPLAAWKKATSGYKGTKQPELCEAAKPFSEPAGKHTPLSGAMRAVASSATGNTHWSGYVDTAGGYTAVGAEWDQTIASNNSTSEETTWVGIGGWYSGDLLQDGTDSPGSNFPYTYPWWEYLGGKSVGVMSVNETFPGNTIEAQVYYSTASSGTAKFYVHDDGAVVLSEQETNINQDYDPSTVEFINERPRQSNGSYFPLSNTATTYFSDANGINSSGSVPVNSNGVIGVVMTTSGSFVAPPCSTSATMLQYPNKLSGDTFESNFCRAS